MLTATAAHQAPPLLQSSVLHHHRSCNVALTYTPIITRRRRGELISLYLTTTSTSRRNRGFLLPLVTAASKSPNSNSTSNADDEDDLYFLLKLGTGSFAGAAAIKYGSILVPGITRPNITLALIMISAPVLVSILILIRQSRVEQQ